MTTLRIKIEFGNAKRKWTSMPQVGKYGLLWILALSICVHVVSLFVSQWIPPTPLNRSLSDVKVRPLTESEKKLLNDYKAEAKKAQRIVETPLEPTEQPVNATSLGVNDHVTHHETKIPKSRLTNSKSQDAAHPQSKPMPSIKNPPKHVANTKTEDSLGNLLVPTNKKRTKTVYEELLPNPTDQAFSTNSSPYIEHMDDNVDDGDRIDMNTTSFRYISYFTGMRKQIENVWLYPQAAVQRGLQGAVQLEMTIEQTGYVSRVRVVNSSGYTVLDDNMLKTIKMASPFAPLPKTWGKNRMIITGTFHHILSYAAH